MLTKEMWKKIKKLKWELVKKGKERQHIRDCENGIDKSMYDQEGIWWWRDWE